MTVVNRADIHDNQVGAKVILLLNRSTGCTLITFDLTFFMLADLEQYLSAIGIRLHFYTALVGIATFSLHAWAQVHVHAVNRKLFNFKVTCYMHVIN